MALRVVGYVRVSTDEQASEGVSLDAQRDKLGAYARLYDLELCGIEVDAGVSAKTLDRPGLRRALDRLTAGEAGGIVVAKLDRLTRSVRDLADLLDDYFGPDAHHQLFSVADSIDTRKASGRMVLNVLMSVSQWERETIVERTRDAMRHKQSRGERVGSVPYGYDLADDGRTLVPNAAELLVIGSIKTWRRSGQSLRSIAAALDKLGVATKNGRPWSHATVQGLLKRLGGDAHAAAG